MKHVWVYIIVSSMGNTMEYPLAIAVGNTPTECFKRGNAWIGARPKVYVNVIALCVPNESVDDEYPTLRWL